MSVAAAVFHMFRKAGLAEEAAVHVAAELNAAIDRRYELHTKQLATRGDLQEVKADLTKTIMETQRWTIGAIGLIVAMVAAIQKLL